MRKQFFLFTLLLCLCTNIAWGQISWIGETISTSEDFYLYNVGHSLFLNPVSPYGSSSTQNKWTFSNTSSGSVTTQYNNSTYYIYVEQKTFGGEAGIRTSSYNVTIESGSTNKSYRFRHKAWNGTKYFNLENANTISAANNTGTQNDWLLIGQNQYHNHFALVAYDAANTTASGYTQGNNPKTYPTNVWNQIQAYLNSTTDYLNYSSWLTTIDKSSSINTATTYLTTTAPAIANEYANALDYISKAKDTLALGKDGSGNPYDADIYNTYSTKITTAESEVEAATSVGDITSAISTLKTATKTFLNDSRSVVVTLINTHAGQAEGLSVQFTTLVNYVATARAATEDNEKTATDLLTIDATLQNYITIATDLIGSDEYSSYTSKRDGAETLADGNKVNTSFDKALDAAISTAESDLLAVHLSSLAEGKADITTINGNIDAAVSTYNTAITAKNSYLEKQAIALDLSNDVATATGLNSMLTSLVETEDEAVTNATTSGAIDVATTALTNAISTYNEALPRYKYALQQVEVAERSGYDASSNLSAINACESATAINTAISDLRNAAKSHITSNTAAGMDMTIFIENNSFESGTLESWNTSFQPGGESDDTGAKATSNETYAASNADGEYLYNTWYRHDNVEEGATLSQSISGLPAGYYKISAYVTSYAGNEVTLDVNSTYYATATPADGDDKEAKTIFNQVSVIVELAEGASMTIQTYGQSDTYGGFIGIAEKSYKKWYKADNFTLQFLGVHPYQAYAYDIVQNANIVGFDKDDYLLTINGTTVESEITEALNGFRTAALNYVQTNSMLEQDITFMLENHGFDYPFDWNYGWSGTNDESKTGKKDDGNGEEMTAFQQTKSKGNVYAWMYRENWGAQSRTLKAGDIYQTITLPKGIYKMTASIQVSSNDNNVGVTSTFYVKNGETVLDSKSIAMKKDGGFETYELLFTLTEETEIRFGAYHNSLKNTSKKIVAVDDFKLYCWGVIKQKDLVDGYAMLYSSSKNLRIDDTDAKVYSATWNNDSDNPVVTLHEDPFGDASERIIEAGKVVLIYNSTKPAKLNYSHTATTATDEISDNLFVHHNGSSTGFTNYVLGKKAGEDVAFHRFTGAESGLANYNVLQLPISPSQAPSAIRIVTEGNTATALVPVYGEDATQASDNANGRKLLIDGKLYIQQGNNLYDALGRKVQ